MKTATIDSITRVSNTNKYIIKLNKKLKYFNYSKNGYERKSVFSFKLKAYKSRQDFEYIFSGIVNLFRLTAPCYRDNVKASLAAYIDYFNLIENGKFSFSSLVGKEVSIQKRGWCLSYDHIKKRFVKGAKEDKLFILMTHKDESNIKYRIKKYNENKNVKHKYDRIILNTFVTFCKGEASVKNEENTDLVDNLEKQLTNVIMGKHDFTCKKHDCIISSIRKLSKNKLYYLFISVARNIVNDLKKDNEKNKRDISKLKKKVKLLKEN